MQRGAVPVSGPPGTVFFLGDPMESLDAKWDSSLRLMEAHRRLGHETLWCTLDDTLLVGRQLWLKGRRVEAADIVWLRLDPAVSTRYTEALRALCHVEARIVNPPAAVLTVHDKRGALEICPRDAICVFAESGLVAAVARLADQGAETVVLKPPSLFGSKGVRYEAAGDIEAIGAAFRDLVSLFGHVILEPYLGPGGGRTPIDLRVLVTPRRVIGAIARLIPLGGGVSDVEKGGPLSPRQRDMTGAAMALMRRHGIVLAGLDFLGDTLTELNISCPGAIPEVNMFCHIRAEDMVVEDTLAELDSSASACVATVDW